MQEERRARRLRILRACVMGTLGMVTTYLLLERSHAEEIGNGSRVVAEILRGERPLSPLSWLAIGLLAFVLSASGHARVGTKLRCLTSPFRPSGRDRVAVPLEAPRGH
jgi:hypothetical protein